MDDADPRLTPEQQSFIEQVGADRAATPSSVAGFVFVYIELPTRTIRHEIDPAGHIVQTDVFPRDAPPDQAA
jgi:hypothetical protein